MMKIIKNTFKALGVEVTKYKPTYSEQVVTLKTDNQVKGNVLISYILEAFLTKFEEIKLIKHNNYGRSLQMAEIFLELGYNIDVIDYRNMTFLPQKKYAFFIDVRHNLERLSPVLNPDCVKIFFIDTAHILYHCAAELKRLLDLQKRKGVTLIPRRFESPNFAIEHADFAISHGGEFTINTFKYADKPIHKICQYHHIAYPYSAQKNIQNCKRAFLWFGSGGFVHKGLDLVIDSFISMPDFNLFICGPIEKEKDFENLYHKELYQTKNIHTVGWVDIASQKFKEITDKCIGLVYPSCSEGGAGCVTQCMHAGLIPIVSFESGIEVNDFGFLLKDCSIESIKMALKEISSFPNSTLKQMSMSAWEYANKNHTKKNFAEEFTNIIKKAMPKYNHKSAP